MSYSLNSPEGVYISFRIWGLGSELLRRGLYSRLSRLPIKALLSGLIGL